MLALCCCVFKLAVLAEVGLERCMKRCNHTVESTAKHSVDFVHTPTQSVDDLARHWRDLFRKCKLRRLCNQSFKVVLLSAEDVTVGNLYRAYLAGDDLVRVESIGAKSQFPTNPAADYV